MSEHSTEHLLDTALNALSDSPAAWGELYYLQSESTMAQSKNESLESLDRSRTRGLGVRLIAESRMGTSFTSELDPDSLARAVARALASARYGKPADAQAYQMPRGDYPDLPSPTPVEFPPELKNERHIQAVLSACAAAKETSGIGYTESHISDSTHTVTIATTDGFFHSESGTRVWGWVEAVAEGEGQKKTATDVIFGFSHPEQDLAHAAARAAHRAKGKLGPASYATGPALVVFSAEQAAELWKLLSQSFYFENILKGTSVFANREGTPVAAPALTFIDDGSDPRGPGPSSMDDEGFATRRSVLVRNGELAAFLHDAPSAWGEGHLPTGNAFRSDFASPPRVGASHFYLEAGRADFTDLLYEAKEGVFVDEMMGLHMADPVSGAFSFGVTGRIIKDGKLGVPVAGLALAGNLYELLHNIKGIGSDFRFFPNGVGSPSVLAGGLTLSGK